MCLCGWCRCILIIFVYTCVLYASTRRRCWIAFTTRTFNYVAHMTCFFYNFNTIQGGVCLKHGARKQLCTYINPLTNEVCTNLAKQGGVCTRHGARREARKQCSHVDPESGEQCTKVARKGGTCIRHGSIERTCAFEGCTNNIVNNGKGFVLFY